MSSTDSPAPVVDGRFAGWRGIVAIAAVVVLGAALLVAFAEAAVRVRQYLRHGTSASLESMYVVDAKTGLRIPRAGAKVGNITINSKGFRGPEIAMPKPAKTVRIAFVGASTTYCAEVSSDAKVWTQIVADQLQREFPGAGFDFINAGVPGYSVSSSTKRFSQYAKEFQPDAVMIYHGTNDMSGELRAIAATQGLWNPDGEMKGWLSRQSLLFDLVEKNLRVRVAQQQIDSGTQRLVLDADAMGHGFGVDLRSLIEEASKSSKHVSIATFSSRLRREQDPEVRKAAAVSALVYMPFMSPDGLIDAYRKYNQVIQRVASETGALLIGGEFVIPGDAQHFVDSVHFSDRGSAAMASRVARALAQDPGFQRLVVARMGM